LIDERLDGEGVVHRTTLRPADHREQKDDEHPSHDGFLVEDDEVLVGRVSVLAVRTVMQRYARPLDPEVELSGPTLALSGDRLRRWRYRAAVDAIGRDYLVWESDSQGPAAALAVSVTAALRHLAMASSRRS
jgi:hypothetical protein